MRYIREKYKIFVLVTDQTLFSEIFSHLALPLKTVALIKIKNQTSIGFFESKKLSRLDETMDIEEYTE